MDRIAIAVVVLGAVLAAGAAARIAGRDAGQATATATSLDVAVDPSLAFGPFATLPAAFTFEGREATRFTLAYDVEGAGDGAVELQLGGLVIGHAPGGSGPAEIVLPRSATGAGTISLAFVAAARERGWSILRPRLVREALPSCGAGCGEQARQLVVLGRAYLVNAAVDPANPFAAWSSLRRALLFLEAVDPHPAAYAETEELLAQARAALDRTCARLRFTATRHFALGDRAAAERAARDILAAFPTDALPCRGLGLHMLDALGVAP